MTLGEFFATKGRNEDALENFKQALEQQPSDHEMLRRIHLDRQKLFQKEDPQKAIQECSLALENYTPLTSKERPGILIELANLYYSQNDYDKAVEKLTEAIQCNIEDPDVSAHILHQRAVIYKIQGEFDLAFNDVSRGIDLKPTNNLGPLLLLRGEVCAEQKKFANAIQNFQDALELAPPKGEIRPQLLRLEAKAWTQLGNFLKPILCLDKALDCEFDDEALKIGLRDDRGFAHLRKGDTAKANQDFSVVLKSEGVDEKYKASLLYDRGLFFQRSNELDDARKDFEAALKYTFDDDVLRQDLAARLKEVTPSLFSSVKGWIAPKLSTSPKE
jgi:tetratricopeptide (TPR) repeat protein